MRILIIDDEENIRRITAVVLEAAGCLVESTTDSINAILRGTPLPPVDAGG